MCTWTPFRRELLLVGLLVLAAQIELWLAPIEASDKPLLVPLALALPISLLSRVRLPLLVLAKLDLRDRTQAVIAAYESGLVRPGTP